LLATRKAMGIAQPRREDRVGQDEREGLIDPIRL
jgi:hypothetical protein